MKKIISMLAVVLTSIFIGQVYAQVAIGKLEVPDESAVLDVVSPTNYYMGVLIPRMSEEDRDKISSPANGLLIYNTDEGCINVYDAINTQWNSLCGGVGKSVFTVGCGDVTVFGTYVKGTPLNNSNYLSVMANVTKAGAYTFTVTTANGYGFNASGTFLNEGIQQISLIGQGSPIDASDPGDIISIIINGVETDICNSPVIRVLPSVSTYTMNCGNAVVNGVYQLGAPLSSSNTITLPVIVEDITTGGSWSISTNTVNGISFRGFGVFLTTGVQNVILYGTGTPTSTDPTNLRLYSNSAGVVQTECDVTVIIATPPKTILTIGSTFYNPALYETGGLRKMMLAPGNYGTNPNSVVKYVQPFTFISLTTGTTTASATTLAGHLTGPNPPDIVMISYYWVTTASTGEDYADVLLEYLNNKGVVLFYCENSDGGYFVARALMRKIFADENITALANGGGAGTRHLIPILNNDPIINGPFGNVGGKYWGEDASTTTPISGIADNANITIYSKSTATASIGQVTAFRHNSLNLVYVGDGGFNSHNDSNSSSNTTYPFWIDPTTSYPIVNPSYGGSGSPIGPIINSIFTANAVAWAIQMAQSNGINTK